MDDRTIQEMEQAANILMVSIDMLLFNCINLKSMIFRIRFRFPAIF